MSLRFDAVLFDLDGTLIDSTELIVRSYQHTLRKIVGVEPSRETIISGFGTPLVDNLHRMSPDPSLVSDLVRVYSEYNERHHDALVTPFEDATRTVHDLHVAGVRLALVTGKRRRYALMGLRLAGLHAQFDAVITPECTDRGKPDPEPVLAALTDLGVPPERALFVGDSPHDIAAAQAAKVAAAAVAWGPFDRATLEAAGPDHWLEAGGDVLALVGLSGTARASA